jgi:hypothetical protein
LESLQLSKSLCQKQPDTIELTNYSVFISKKHRSTKTFPPFLRFINEWFIFEENLELSALSNQLSAVTKWVIHRNDAKS